MARYTKVKKVVPKQSKAADAKAPVEIDVKLHKFFDLLVKFKYPIIGIISIVLIVLIAFSIIKSKTHEKKVKLAGEFTPFINVVKTPVIEQSEIDKVKDKKKKIIEHFSSNEVKIKTLEKTLKSFENKSKGKLPILESIAHFILNMKKNNLKEAYALIKKLNSLKEVGGFSIITLREIAYLAAELKQYDEAEKYYKKFTELNGILSKMMAWKALGDFYNPMIYKNNPKKDIKKAKECYEKVKKLVDNETSIKTSSQLFIKNEASQRISLLSPNDSK